jgi:transposase InsO family protein
MRSGFSCGDSRRKIGSIRGAMKPREKCEVPVHTAKAPCEVWSWDITYLRRSIRGVFYYLHLFVDVYSRKIVGWDVFDCESDEHSSAKCEQQWATTILTLSARKSIGKEALARNCEARQIFALWLL